MNRPKNNYHSYLNNLSGAVMRVLQTRPYIPPAHPDRNAASLAALTFINKPSPNEGQPENSEFDFLKQKNELAQGKVQLISADVYERMSLKNDNIKALYDELLLIDNWRLSRPFSESSQKDKVWLDLNKMELKVREQIRRELQDNLRDTMFNKKDLRESVLDYKKLQQKEALFAGGLEMVLDENR